MKMRWKIGGWWPDAARAAPSRAAALLKGEREVMAEQNDIARLYREFEVAFVDVLTARGELLLPRRSKLYQARTRLCAHKDFAQREYEAAVLRAEARAWKILG
jgi:hypothetical protein